TDSTRLPMSKTDTQKLPGTVAVPEINTVCPATAVVLLITRHDAVATLGVPTPMPSAAPGLTLVSVTFTPPISFTANACKLWDWTVTAPENGSVSVGPAGVGAAGAFGSLHAAAPTAAATATSAASTRARIGATIAIIPPSLHDERHGRRVRQQPCGA